MARMATPDEIGKLMTARFRKYPWDEWDNGETWVAVKGEDFEGPAQNFRSAVYAHASNMGSKAKARISDKEDSVTFRILPRESV